jgi:predicted Zn finger-like uncharacterized protein
MKTQCPNCKARFNVDDKFAGKQAKCPKCVKPFTIAPFIDAPVEPAVAVAAPIKPPAPAPIAEAPAKVPEPISPPVKSPEPVTPPARKPESIAAPAKIAEPVKEAKPAARPASKALSKIVFVYSWAGVRIIAGILAGFGLMLALRKGGHVNSIKAFAAADVFLVGSVLIELLLFYKMWAPIQDGKSSISPGRAVGFLFIPVFNIYWALSMVIGFAEDYNSFINKRSIKTKELPTTLFMIYAFVFMLTILFVTTPMIGIFAFVKLIYRAFTGYPDFAWPLLIFVLVAGIAHFITYTLVATKTCNAINALPGKV